MAEIARENAVDATNAIAYASWGQRFAAWLVDWCLLGTIMFFVALVITGLALPNATGGEAIGIWAIAFALVFPLAVAYFALLHGGKRGQTIGKRTVGIAVRRVQSLERVGYLRALLRTLETLGVWALALTAIGIFAVLADYLWPLWDSRNQALHDKFSGTVVVRV